MPELPEVETIKEALVKSISNASINSVSVRNRHLRQFIPESFEKNIEKAIITRIYRIGKYALLDLNNGHTIILHFGMSGKLRFVDSNNPSFEKHDHIVFYTSKGTIAYNDPRKFGLVSEESSAKIKNLSLFANLGPDPFDQALSTSYLQNKFKKKQCPIKIALLDQSIICGIGNIYASEALYEARISPLRSCTSLTANETKKLISAIRSTLQKAIDAGGSTLHDYRKPDGSTGYFQLQHAVYGKEGMRCPYCSSNCSAKQGIRRIVQGGRSTFYCPHLQK